MAILKFCFYFMALFGNVNASKDHVVIIGKTQNRKGGPIVISKDDTKTYFLDGISYWDEKDVGKMVRVLGKLLIEKTEPLKPGEPQKQMMVGIRRTILQPKWEWVK